MNGMLFAWDKTQIDSLKIEEGTDSVHGPTTTFKDVVIASQIIHPYEDGKAYKPADELKMGFWTWEGRWAKSDSHPETGIIANRDNIQGKTINVRFVKNLKDHRTGRPNRRGIIADLVVFNKKVTPETLEDMKNGKKTDVSIGFWFSKDNTPGTIDEDGHPLNGMSYDYIQRNFMGDHTAFALEDGRCPMPLCGIGADQLLMMGDVEETEESIRVPVNTCKVTATISISEKQGISALYCGGEKKIRTYIFMKSKGWTKEKALNWVKEHKSSDVMALTIEDMTIEELKTHITQLTERLDKLAEPNQDEDWPTLFEKLPEDVKQVIIDAGLCPECDEDGNEEETNEVHLWVDTWILENIGEDAVLTYAQKKARPDSDYAYIESGCKKEDGKTQQKCRHLLIHDPAHVRAALSAIGGARTGKVPPYASKAKPKVCAAAKKFKIKSEVCGTKGGDEPPSAEALLKKSRELLKKD